MEVLIGWSTGLHINSEKYIYTKDKKRGNEKEEKEELVEEGEEKEKGGCRRISLSL